jgi:hypothetical protein
MFTKFNATIVNDLQRLLWFLKQNPACHRLLAVMLLVTMACGLPGVVQKTPVENPSTPAPTPTIPSEPAITVTPGSGPSGFIQLPPSVYQTGEPVVTELYVSADGDDNNDGLSAASPLQTLTAAWYRIPTGATLTTNGYRINLLPGTYPCEPAEPDNCQNSFADRHGSFQFPIILSAINGPGTVTIRGGFDISEMSYLYLINLTLAGGNPLPTNQSGNNLLHLANVDHVLLLGMTLAGPDCDNDSCTNLQEVLKVNQAQYLYIENSTIGGAWHSSVDFFSVQYGHFLNNNLHTAGQWCMYVKGGTASLRVEGNEFHGCQLGFQAGQSSNLAVTQSPWVHYEAYDIKFVNNLLHNIPGVGLSVSGGYNILFAYNTLYQVGTAADPGYPLIQAIQGERGCNATDEIPNPLPVCETILAQGGWGPAVLTDNLAAIPNRNVYIFNNLIYNPAPAQTLYAHLYIAAPFELPAGFQNLPNPVPADKNLVIAGNLIWNGPPDLPLGVDESTGCTPSNPTCSPAQLLRDNTINSLEPQLVDPDHGDYRPLPGGNVYTAATVPIPDFSWETFSPSVPAGDLSNAVGSDRLGNPHINYGPPGAYTGRGSQ